MVCVCVCVFTRLACRWEKRSDEIPKPKQFTRPRPGRVTNSVPTSQDLVSRPSRGGWGPAGLAAQPSLEAARVAGGYRQARGLVGTGEGARQGSRRQPTRAQGPRFLQTTPASAAAEALPWQRAARFPPPAPFRCRRGTPSRTGWGGGC